METIQSLKTTYDLVLWSFDPKTIEVLVRSRLIHLWNIIIVCGRKWSFGAETVKKFKVQIWPLTFWPKIKRGPPQVKVNIYVKYHHCLSNRIGVMVQNYFFHRRTDRWTCRQTDAMLKPVYLNNLFSMWRNRWKMTPWRSKFHGGVTFSRPLVQNLMFKFDQCQLLTLKNDSVVYVTWYKYICMVKWWIHPRCLYCLSFLNSCNCMLDDWYALNIYITWYVENDRSIEVCYILVQIYHR